jgi:hypothetical protein
VKQIAKGLDDHEVTIAADIAALRKTGGRNSVRYSLIQEIQPVTVGILAATAFPSAARR